jgi:hypothetical protein
MFELLRARHGWRDLIDQWHARTSASPVNQASFSQLRNSSHETGRYGKKESQNVHRFCVTSYCFPGTCVTSLCSHTIQICEYSALGVVCYLTLAECNGLTTSGKAAHAHKQALPLKEFSQSAALHRGLSDIYFPSYITRVLSDSNVFFYTVLPS